VPSTWRSALSAAVQPALRRWNRIPLRVQSKITVCLPLLAVCVSAGLALSGNIQRADIETDIQRKFEMTAALDDVTTLMVNAETGMRGYLLTRQGEFLEPFDLASAQLPGAMSRLTDLATAEPGEKPRLDKLQRITVLRDLTDRQLADLGEQRRYVTPDGGSTTVPDLLAHLTYGKSLMDQIRQDVLSMQDEERGLLDDRIADINAIRTRDYISVVLALVVAVGVRFVAWHLVKRGTLHRVERLTENVRSLRRSRPLPFPPSGKQDELGQLETEIHLIRLDGEVHVPAADVVPPREPSAP
jgi:CHASE3 domain sensor protein